MGMDIYKGADGALLFAWPENFSVSPKHIETEPDYSQSFLLFDSRASDLRHYFVCLDEPFILCTHCCARQKRSLNKSICTEGCTKDLWDRRADRWPSRAVFGGRMIDRSLHFMARLSTTASDVSVPVPSQMSSTNMPSPTTKGTVLSHLEPSPTSYVNRHLSALSSD
jgi:hypothetical protein